MRITVLGATGSVGSRVVTEALSRGHQVTAVARNSTRFNDLPAAAKVRVGDAGNVKNVAELSAGQDVIINATRPAPGSESRIFATTKALMDGLAPTGVRLLVVGGAATLTVPGERTGNYRLGTDELLLDAEGNSTISMEDLAVVLLDEAERPKHHRTRFTAAY